MNNPKKDLLALTKRIVGWQLRMARTGFNTTAYNYCQKQIEELRAEEIKLKNYVAKWYPNSSNIEWNGHDPTK